MRVPLPQGKRLPEHRGESLHVKLGWAKYFPISVRHCYTCFLWLPGGRPYWHRVPNLCMTQLHMFPMAASGATLLAQATYVSVQYVSTNKCSIQINVFLYKCSYGHREATLLAQARGGSPFSGPLSRMSWTHAWCTMAGAYSAWPTQVFLNPGYPQTPYSPVLHPYPTP